MTLTPDPTHVVALYGPGEGFTHAGRRHGAIFDTSSAACTCGEVKRFHPDPDGSRARQWARRHEDPVAPPAGPAPAELGGLGGPALAVDDDSAGQLAAPDPAGPAIRSPWWAGTLSGSPRDQRILLAAAMTAAVLAGLGVGLGLPALAVAPLVLAAWLAASLSLTFTAPREGS